MALNDYQQKRLSKTISTWLRHHPEKAELVPDEFGWVGIDQLLAALVRRDVFITAEELEILNCSADKVRWRVERNNNRIRATHGHSIPVIIGEAEMPPDILYHGTGRGFLPAISKHGLLPMKRQFVHLSSDAETARAVGKRHSSPCVLVVAARGLYDAGFCFYHTSGDVWLTKAVPIEFLSNEKAAE